MIPYDAVDTFEWLIVRLVNVEPSKCMLQWVVSGVPSGSPSHEYWRSSVPPLATLIAAWTFTRPAQVVGAVTSELTSVVFCGIAASGWLLPPPPSSAFWQAPSEDTSDTASTI